MRYIKSDYNQFLDSAASTTLHTGAGKIRAIMITCSSTTPASLTLYDNTAASGNVLLIASVSTYSPFILVLPKNYPLIFDTGLHGVCATNVRAFILTEV
jgi:hypothetical protein